MTSIRLGLLAIGGFTVFAKSGSRLYLYWLGFKVAQRSMSNQKKATRTEDGGRLITEGGKSGYASSFLR